MFTQDWLGGQTKKKGNGHSTAYLPPRYQWIGLRTKTIDKNTILTFQCTALNRGYTKKGQTPNL